MADPLWTPDAASVDLEKKMEAKDLPEGGRDEVRRFAEFLRRRKEKKETGECAEPPPEGMRDWLLGKERPMTHEAAFMAEILAHPEDDAPRLLFADWLDENGQPERAEFVRVQRRLAGMRFRPPHDHSWKPAVSPPLPKPHCAACRQAKLEDALRRRERALLFNATNWWTWLADLYRITGRSAIGMIGHVSDPVDFAVGFRRGFVESIECTAADFLAHADALTAAAPIRAVRLTTWPEFATRSSPSMKNQARLHGRREWFVLETDLIGSLTSQVALELLHAEWDKIDFTLPPVVAFPGNLEETTVMIRDEIIRSLGIPRDMIR